MSGRSPEGRPLRVLALGMNYAPEPVGVAVYSQGLAEGLARRGHEVSWIAATPWYPAWAPMPGLARGWSVEQIGGVRVTRCPHPIPVRPTASRRLVQQTAWAGAALAPVLRAAARRPDVVLAVAPALLAAPVALAAARLAGAPSWLHVQDLEVDAAAGLLGLGRLAGGAAGHVERGLLRAFDRVSTISSAMRGRIEAKGVAPERTLVMRNWADLEAMGPVDRTSSLRAEWGLEGRRVALYSGSIGRKQGLEMLAETVRRLRGRPELADLVVLVCGDGPAWADLAQAARSLGPGGPELRLAPLQPVERLGDLLALADVHLLPQRADAADLVLPSKLANMLASGRPVIACAAPDTQLAREVAGCGLVVPPEDPGALAAALADLAAAPEMRGALGRAARLRAEARWSREATIDLAESVLRTLTAAGDGAARPARTGPPPRPAPRRPVADAPVPRAAEPAGRPRAAGSA